MKKRNLVILLTALLIVVIVFSFCACDLFPSSSGTSKYVKPKNNTENKQEVQNNNDQSSQTNPQENDPALLLLQNDIVKLFQNGYPAVIYLYDSTIMSQVLIDYKKLVDLNGFQHGLICEDDWQSIILYFDNESDAENAVTSLNTTVIISGWNDKSEDQQSQYNDGPIIAVKADNHRVLFRCQNDPVLTPALTSDVSSTSLLTQAITDFLDIIVSRQFTGDRIMRICDNVPTEDYTYVIQNFNLKEQSGEEIYYFNSINVAETYYINPEMFWTHLPEQHRPNPSEYHFTRKQNVVYMRSN